MSLLLSELKKGDKAQIVAINIDNIPLKLIEMGCLPGNTVELILIAPLGDPFYFNFNDSYVAIRKEIAKEISVVIEN